MPITKFDTRVAIAAAATLATVFIGARDARAQSQSDAFELEVVVVTARKREEVLQDVPISIEAISGTALSQQGIKDTSQLVGRVAGLTIQDGGPGYRTIYVRGVASERGNAATTGFYLDEAPVPPGGVVQAMIEPLVFDVERVEVLRGPQGTVFGGSSMGGTIRVISKRPSLTEFGGTASVDLSTTSDGGTNYQVGGALNLPIVSDKFAMRFSAGVREQAGFIDKVVGPLNAQRQFTGPTATFEDVNDAETRTARVSFLWQATDALTIEPSFFYQRIESDDFASFDRPGAEREQFRRFYVPEPLTDDTRVSNLKVTLGAGPVQLLSSTSYNLRRAAYSEDGVDYFGEVFFPGVFRVNDVDGTGRESQWTQELRASSRGDGKLNWVAGVYYEKFEREGTLIWIVPGLNRDFPLPIVRQFCPADVCFSQNNELDRKQKAAFGELSYDFSDRWSASVGLRYFDFDVKVRSGAAPATDTSEDGVSPRASVSFKATENATIYATYSEGFRPGGPNRVMPPFNLSRCQAQYGAAGIVVPNDGQIPPYESDEIKNIELGAKLQWGDSRSTTNFAIYQIDWDDIQQLYFPSCGFGSNQNFGKAKIRGAEFDFDAKLGGAVSVFGGLNYNDAVIDEDIPQVGVSKGLQVQNAPKFTGNLNFRVGFAALGSESAYALLTARYTDESLRDFELTNPRKLQDSYTVVNARVGGTWAGWDVTLFADNITDDDPGVSNFLSTFGPTSRERMFTIQPRTFGISVQRGF
jgi:iron complex outermembrane recepter protein